MKASTEVAFELKTVLIPIVAISPKADFIPEVRKSRKYRQIAASIEHVGLIEPLIVSPVGDGTFLLLDGALRLDILKERQDATVRCILSTDDEGYTYNKRVSHLSNIGEHYMILKALSNGVSEQMISTSLNVDVETIRRKRSLLDGICPEAIQLLTNRRVSVHAYGFLRRMKPLGQIQAAERMIHANNYSATMAKTLLTITKPELVAQPAKNKPGKSRRRCQTLSSSGGVGYAADGRQAGGGNLCDPGTRPDPQPRICRTPLGKCSRREIPNETSPRYPERIQEVAQRKG